MWNAWRREYSLTGRISGRSRDVDAIIDAIPDGRKSTLARLRDVIHSGDPGIVETVKWRKPSNPLGVAVFEHDGIVCILIPLKGRVRISFAEGALLPDPARSFNAQLKGVSRAIDFPIGIRIDEDAVMAIVRAGVERRKERKPHPVTARGTGSKRSARH